MTLWVGYEINMLLSHNQSQQADIIMNTSKQPLKLGHSEEGCRGERPLAAKE